MKKPFFLLVPSFTKSPLLIALIVCCTISIPLTSIAQSNDPGIDKLYLTTGVGIGSNLTIDHSTITVPPISVALDIRILPQVTIGPYLAYERNSSYAGTEYGVIGARGTYHFAVPSKVFGFYAGGVLGYVYFDSPVATDLYDNDTHYVANQSGSIATSSQSHVGYSVFLGGQAHLSNSVLAFAEFGYGISYLNLGFSFKLK